MTKVSELIGRKLDEWVARAEGLDMHAHGHSIRVRQVHGEGVQPTVIGHLGGPYEPQYTPSTNPLQGHPIIDRENIVMWPAEGGRGECGYALGALAAADKTGYLDLGPNTDGVMFGETKLIAAMRARVAQVYGNEVPA